MSTNPAFLSSGPQNAEFDVTKWGFAIINGIIDRRAIDSLVQDLSQLRASDAVSQRAGRPFGIRDLFNVVPSAKVLAANGLLTDLARVCVGTDARLVRGIFFDKTPQANWKVNWHQDLTIAVRQRREVAGFGPWTIKAGLPHVQPPASVLEGMVALRIHLDDANESNGALKVIPGSHGLGRLAQSQVQNLTRKTEAFVCDVACGGVLVMRPLLVHSSSTCSRPRHRRVIHLEFASGELPGGLEWPFS